LKGSRIDVETVCGTCSLVFTIHGIEKYIKEVGSGYDLSSLKCPSCEQKNLKFDLLRVEDNGFVEHHMKQVHQNRKKC